MSRAHSRQATRRRCGTGMARATLLVLLALTLAALAAAWWSVRGDGEATRTADSHRIGASTPIALSTATPITSGMAATPAVERGRYLALAGNCAGCHTAAGEPPYAGGHGIPTPFGTVFTRNLTPDADTGLGRWSAEDFWQAMHFGRSRDGSLLYPAFPYTNYTHMNRADVDDLWAYLRSLPAVAQANRPHQLAFPFSTQAALAVWRALYFAPEVQQPEPTRSAAWNRGAYLVRGLGHCDACHAPRGLMGAVANSPELQGGLNQQLRWYAPPLAPAAGSDLLQVQRETLALLQSGRNSHSIASGPMADVVFNSLQHLRPDDLAAMALFLSQLPAQPAQPASPEAAALPVTMKQGQDVYENHCTNCHGAQGQGEPGAYPALAGNAAVRMEPPSNLMRLVIEGGFPADTPGHPRPHGMPPFGPTLSGEQIAAVLTYIRNAWGQRAPPVTALQVNQAR